MNNFQDRLYLDIRGRHKRFDTPSPPREAYCIQFYTKDFLNKFRILPLLACICNYIVNYSFVLQQPILLFRD